MAKPALVPTRSPLPEPVAIDAKVLESVLIGGDLAKLTTTERLSYYRAVCDSLGLNPLTKPFQYIALSGQLRLYATKDCGEQLRKLHGISVNPLSVQTISDVYVVSVTAQTANGRTDADLGAVSIAGLKGDALANAMMKATTKAKRRVTLSICGLGMLDEAELETIPEVKSQARREEQGRITTEALQVEQANAELDIGQFPSDPQVVPRAKVGIPSIDDAPPQPPAVDLKTGEIIDPPEDTQAPPDDDVPQVLEDGSFLRTALIADVGEVATGRKRNGQPWTLYAIQLHTGETVRTFSKTIHDEALHAKAESRPCRVRWITKTMSDGKATTDILEFQTVIDTTESPFGG